MFSLSNSPLVVKIKGVRNTKSKRDMVPNSLQ